MTSRLLRPLALVLVFGLVLLTLVDAHWRGIADYPLKTVSVDPERISQRHLGEWQAGRVLVQPIDWQRLEPWALDRHGSDPLCLGVFFANYYDRDNTGQLHLTLERPVADAPDAWTEFAAGGIDVSRIRNYRYEGVCFPELSLADLAGQPVRFRLEALDSPPDRSVTIYVAELDGNAPSASVDGAGISESVIYRLQARAEHGREQWAAWSILGAVAVLLTLVFAGLLPEAPRSPRSGRRRWWR